MGKPQAPQTPSPTETAAAQTGSNLSTAIGQQQLNTIDQYGPQGSVTYTQTGTYDYTDPSTGQRYSLPKLRQTTTLSPAQQQIYDATMRTQGNLAGVAERQSQAIGGLLANRFTTDGLPAAGNVADVARANPTLQRVGANDYSADRQRVEDALMGRLNTQLDRDRAAMEASLANRGIRSGSTAYTDAMRDFGQNVAESRTAAILGAGQEQNRLQQLEIAGTGFNNNVGQQQFGNAQTLFGLGNSARQQALNERLTERNQALNENIGLATGSQVQMPSFAGAPQTGLAGTDVAGITANANAQAQNAYNTQLGQWNNTAGGLFSLGASALPLFFSDERLKTDIKDTGAEVAGVPIKTYRWKGTGANDVGVLAQDVEKKHPEMVDKNHPSGYRRVNYGKLMQLGASSMRRAA